MGLFSLCYYTAGLGYCVVFSQSWKMFFVSFFKCSSIRNGVFQRACSSRANRSEGGGGKSAEPLVLLVGEECKATSGASRGSTI